MSGLEMRYTLDDAGLERQIDALIARGGKLKPAFDDIGQDMVSVTARAFERSMSPEGVAWPQSGAAKREGRRTLVKTTNLKGSFSYIAGEAGVSYGTNVPYAAFHQTGYSFHHAGRIAQQDQGAVFADTLIKVPARPFVGASEKDIARWASTLADYLGGEGAAGAP